MFISLLYKDSESNKKVLAMLSFEKTSFLMKYVEDDTHKRTIITDITLKIEYTNDGRFSRQSEDRFLKMSYSDFRNILRLLGEQQYGPFYNHVPLKYKTVVFATSAFAEETITIDYSDAGSTTDGFSSLEDRVSSLESGLQFISIPDDDI